MRLLPDPAAADFAAAVRDLLRDAAGAEAARQAWDSAAGRIPGLWQRLAAVGVTGLTVPEEYGGSGMDLTAAAPVLVEAGRAAVPEPLVETLAGVALLTAAGGAVAETWLPRVATGDAVLALVPAPGSLVCGARWADLFLARDGSGLRAVARDEAEVAPAAFLDHGAGVGTVTWPDSAGAVVAGGGAAVAGDTAAVAAAAVLVGLAQEMLDMSVRYALQREQFGKPIGSFQAVKHQLADVYVDNAFAAPVVHRAAWSVAHDTAGRARDASHAALAAGRAATRAARTALQVHAGIGYTFEHDLHRWMKRTWTLASQWGDETFHRARVAAAVLADRPPPRIP